MSGQMFRWAGAFTATAALAGSLLVSAVQVPVPVVAESVVRRDPAAVSPIELELILNKIREGDLLSMKKDLAGAQQAWKTARQMGAGLWPIHEGLGDSYARAKLYDDALREYRIAEPMVPEKQPPLRLGISAKRAAVLGAAGRPLEAIQAYLDLNQPPTFGMRIFDLALGSDRAAAVKLIERHAEVYDARLFKIVAGLLKSLDRNGDAAEALAKHAIRVAPWDEAMNRKVVEELREARKLDVALEVCRAWVRAVPQSLDGYQAMGDVLWDAGREREALVAYSSIVDIRPGDAASQRRLGEIYQRHNRPDEALAQFERGWKLAPNDAGLRARLVEGYQARLAKLKGEGKLDDVRAVRKSLAALSVQEGGLFDIKVIMTWDVMSDVDLDVVELDGVRINHANRASKIGGMYYADNTSGLGPETYTLPRAQPGTYRIGAHLHSGAKSTVKFVVILHEDSPQEERREETIILEKAGETPTFIRDIIIP